MLKQNLLLKLLQSKCSFLEISTLILLTAGKQIAMCKHGALQGELQLGPPLSQGSFSGYNGIKYLDCEGCQKTLDIPFL